MSLADIISVTITRVTGAVTQQGFSTPLVLAYHTRWTDERVRSYASLDELTDDGFTSDDAVYKICSAIWSQPDPPATVKVGRRANAFTQTVRLTPTAANSTPYTIELDGLEATYTSDASATAAEICTGLVAAINALADADAIVTSLATSVSGSDLDGAELTGAVGYRALSPSRRLFFTLSSHADFDAGTATVTGKDAAGNTITEAFTIPNGGGGTVTGGTRFARVTRVEFPAGSGTGGSWTLGTMAPWSASDDTTHVTLTNPPGQLGGLEVTGAGVLSVSDLTTNPGLAADLAAVRAEDDDWYCLLLDSNGEAEILAAAAIIEPLTPKKILVAQNADTACINGDAIDDVMYQAKDLDYFRSPLIFHPTIGLNFAAAAFVGSALAADPGSVTWNLRELVGIASYSLTSAQRAALVAKNGNGMEVIAGRKVTFSGVTPGGEWIDIIHGLDWLHARIGERIFSLLLAAAAAKVPFTDKGIARVHAELRAQLTEASGAPSNLLESFTTSVPKASTLTSVQRGTRVLPSVTFNSTVQGAIHAVNVAGTVAA